MTSKGYEPREWRFREESPLSFQGSSMLEDLQSRTGLERITLDLCLSRGLETPEKIHEFLNPRLEALTPSSRIAGMEAAVSRLIRARESGERVRIFGDYDVDGTTGAALLGWFFREIGVAHEIRQPDRFKDGYGLNIGAVEQAVADGATLMVTVDCGITSFAAIDRARELGLDVIVVDHHQLDPVKGLPAALAVINPQRPDCESELRQLCGCGLAFYLCVALRGAGRERGWWKDRPVPNLKQHLDLVVMATAADMVPLTGDNHVLVRHGMEVLKQTRKPGVRALLVAAGVGDRDLSPGHLGFVIGPRINASGRLASASHALELLLTEDEARARELAQMLEGLNSERAEIQNRIWDEVKLKVEEGIASGRFQHGIVVGDPGWHEGVVGIVASRVVETFRRPAIVLSMRENDAKGSVRSFAGKNVLEALHGSKQHLKTFGGHAHAAGVSLELDSIGAFAAAFDEVLAGLPEDSEKRALQLERQAALEELSIKALEELERLGPFGPGNPEPVFSIAAGIREHRLLKDRHLKLDLQSGALRVDAVWFNAVDQLEWLLGERTAAKPLWEWAGVPELNRFRGRVTPTFRIRDVRRLTESTAKS